MGVLKLNSEEILLPLVIDPRFLGDYISVDTKKTYNIAIRDFFAWLTEYHKDILCLSKVEHHHVSKYRDYLIQFCGTDGNEMAPTSVNLKLAAISAYFEFHVKEDLLKSNVVKSIRRPKKEVKTPTQALTKDQARQLLDCIHSDESGPLHKALLFTLWMTGLRKSAILKLKRQDYFETNHGKILRVVDKGGKQIQKLVHPELELALEEYLDWMNDRDRKRSPTDWLFVPTKNPKDPKNLEKQINPKTLNRIIEKYCKRAGIAGKISAHSARATFIEVLLDSGANIVDVKDEVGHSSVTTTQEYDKRRKGLKKSLVRNLKY